MSVNAQSESKRHRWTNNEIKTLMVLWDEVEDVDQIAAILGTTRYAINKMVNRLRREGVPLAHRTRILRRAGAWVLDNHRAEASHA